MRRFEFPLRRHEKYIKNAREARFSIDSPIDWLSWYSINKNRVLSYRREWRNIVISLLSFVVFFLSLEEEEISRERGNEKNFTSSIVRYRDKLGI